MLPDGSVDGFGVSGRAGVLLARFGVDGLLGGAF